MWMEELGAVTHPLFALVAISFIAYVPGFMNAFLVTTLLLDRRPKRAPLDSYPGVTILIAAYNEGAAIAETIASAAAEDYAGPLEILVLSDGSSDNTVSQAYAAKLRANLSSDRSIRIIEYTRNRGKAAVLNAGLKEASHDLIVTIDADTLLNPDALTFLIERYANDPARTVAVAGAVLVRNARDTLLTGAQEWDYYHGIAAVKRMQSMYHGTLVAQGAFSVYSKQALEEVGGWPECVGEDIVLTWALLKKDYRIGYAEDAIVFTNAPRTFRQFALQRKRWARGMIEALHHHEDLVVQAAADRHVHLVEPALPAARSGLHLHLHSRSHRGDILRQILGRRTDDPGVASARRLVEPRNPPNPAANGASYGSQNATPPWRTVVLPGRLCADDAADLRVGLLVGIAGPDQKMGNQVNCTSCLVAGLCLLSWPVAANASAEEDLRTRMAVQIDTFLSADAEKTVVWKTGLNFDLRHKGPEDYLGIRVEDARFKPLGQSWRDDQRIYLRAAHSFGDEWKWNATIGTDGHTMLGSATLHDEAAFRKELFLEREIVETPQGLTRRIYYTFGGAAIDLPVNQDNVLTLVAGLQDFTGDNLRRHLRATAVHVFDRENGLSVQLRTRYFHNSEPREYDYYSPRWYASAIPVLQMRRFVGGWRTLLVGGVGVQRDDGSKWKRSSYFNAQVTSAPKRGWSGNAAVLFSETPTVAGDNYNYFQLTFGLMRSW